MLDSVLLSVAASAIVAACVYFLLSWQIRARVRECELAVDLLHEAVMRHQKRQAGDASVASRRARAELPNPIDEALVSKAMQEKYGDPDATVEGVAPWWKPLMKGK